jgi:hypothetical protein
VYCTYSFGLGQGPVIDFCEHSNELSGSIKFQLIENGNIISYTVRDSQLHEKPGPNYPPLTKCTPKKAKLSLCLTI